MNLIFCPPAVFLRGLEATGKVELGAQDCSLYGNGAYTGELSASLLKACGAAYVILGHMERGKYAKETLEDTHQKLIQATAVGLVPILCVGETMEEKKTGQTQGVITGQLQTFLSGVPNLDRVLIAYEPQWAIGTGQTPSPDETNKTLGWIKEEAQRYLNAPLVTLYGGSVSYENTGEFLKGGNVDGFLVGGRSLSWKSLEPIYRQLVA